MTAKPGKRPRKRTRGNVRVTPNAIIIKLSQAQKKKAKEIIRKSGVAKFKIEEIKVKSMPSSGLKISTILED